MKGLYDKFNCRRGERGNFAGLIECLPRQTGKRERRNAGKEKDMSYIDKIKDRAKLDRKTIVLPESKDKRTLLAAAKIMEEGIADIIMIGDEEKITDGAGWLEVDLTGVTIINPSDTPRLDGYVELLYETRKAKGMTLEIGRAHV